MIHALANLSEERQRIFSPDCDAYRLLPEDMLWRGVSIDYLAGRFLVSLRNTQLPEQLRAWLKEQDADTYIKELTYGEMKPPVPLSPPALPTQFHVSEEGALFLVDMGNGYSQGFFLDQRVNRVDLRKRCCRGNRVLNLFAYTGTFSVSAALAGAVTTTLDLAQPCLDRARENMTLNGIDPSLHFFCRGDAFEWLLTFARQGRRFDFIVLDPPTFARDAHGRVRSVKKDYTELVRRAVGCLTPTGGQILCTTNCRSVSSDDFRKMVQAGAPRHSSLRSVRMPFDFLPDNYLKTIWLNYRPPQG